jgi:hypothetical protein
MASVLAVVLLLGAMFAGALAVDGWRASRLRAWAAAGGWAPVNRETDGGALLAHTSRLAKRLRSFGLTFHQATTADEVWLAEHRAGLPTGRAEKWYTLVVVRVPGASLPRASGGVTSATALDQALPVLRAWPHGGDVDIEGDVVRWRRQGLLWPWNAAQTVAQGRELAALVRHVQA